jgi:hypothetical protein
MKLQTAIFLAVTVVVAVLLIVDFRNPATAGEGLKITEMAVTTKVVRGKPIDAVRRISSISVKVLYCFTRIVNESGEETTIKHVWYHNGEKLRVSEFPVKGKKWRTYSKRDIDKGSVGNWRVDALDSDGNVLKSVEFRIN